VTDGPPAPLRLITIPASHYCEKARWGLERAGIAYVEQGHAPLFSRLAVRRHGVWSSVPVLITPDGPVCDSTAILRWADDRIAADRRLFPSHPAQRAEVEELEEMLDARLGPHTRRVAYDAVFADRDVALGVLSEQPLPPFQRRVIGALYPAVRAFMMRALKIDAAGVERSNRRIDEVFADIGARLADGRRFLVGDRMTAADLAFAALAAPAVVPSGYGATLPSPEQLSPAYRARVESLRATPAGAFALGLYAQHRHAHLAAA
jgi:glutathione S-transferase